MARIEPTDQARSHRSSPIPAPVPIVAALVVAVLGTIYFAGGTLGPFDGRAEGWDALREPWRTIALTVDFCGEPLGSTILTGIVVAVCLLLRRARLAVTAVAGIGVTIAATTALKPIVGRTIHGDYLSFPSGHTAFASALALIVALTVIDVFHPGHHGRSLTIAALVLPAGAAMGWAQVMLSAHYPTDTLGGFCTALATVPATAHLVDRAWKPRG